MKLIPDCRDVPGSLVAWRRKNGRPLARDSQRLQNGQFRADLLFLFFPFFSSHRKALTEPATTIVQSFYPTAVCCLRSFDRLVLENNAFLDRKFAFRWVLLSEGDGG